MRVVGSHTSTGSSKDCSGMLRMFTTVPPCRPRTCAALGRVLAQSLRHGCNSGARPAARLPGGRARGYYAAQARRACALQGMQRSELGKGRTSMHRCPITHSRQNLTATGHLYCDSGNHAAVKLAWAAMLGFSRNCGRAARNAAGLRVKGPGLPRAWWRSRASAPRPLEAAGPASGGLRRGEGSFGQQRSARIPLRPAV